MTMGQRLAILGTLAFIALLAQTLLAQGTAGAGALLANPWLVNEKKRFNNLDTEKLIKYRQPFNPDT